jgi:hypothetical protein
MTIIALLRSRVVSCSCKAGQIGGVYRVKVGLMVGWGLEHDNNHALAQLQLDGQGGLGRCWLGGVGVGA